MSRRALTALLATAAVLAGAAGAIAAALHTQTASASGITATFTYRGAEPTISGAHLTIARAGQTVFAAAISSPVCGKMCAPAQFGRHASSVGIVPLAAGGPQVLLELYGQGANCCFVDQVFAYDAQTNTYLETEHDFADAGATVRRLSGQWRFVSSDPGFKYAFTDGADSGEPLQIWKYAAGAFTDVTRAYPALVRRNAAFWLRTFHAHPSDGVGLLSPWAADEELLGHDRLVQSTLSAQVAAGHLHAPSGWPSGARFVRALNRLLVKLHYRR